MAAGATQPLWLRTASILAYSYSFLVFGLEVNLLGPTAIDLAARAGVVEADLVRRPRCSEALHAIGAAL
jgi:hypothetical protein